MKYVHIAAAVLVIVGALNIGSMGLFGMDFLGHLFGKHSVAHTVDILIGLAGVFSLVCFVRGCKCGMHCHCGRKK